MLSDFPFKEKHQTTPDLLPSLQERRKEDKRSQLDEQRKGTRLYTENNTQGYRVHLEPVWPGQKKKNACTEQKSKKNKSYAIDKIVPSSIQIIPHNILSTNIKIVGIQNSNQ